MYLYYLNFILCNRLQIDCNFQYFYRFNLDKISSELRFVIID